jgi:hypothetical protein
MNHNSHAEFKSTIGPGSELYEVEILGHATAISSRKRLNVENGLNLHEGNDKSHHL